MRLLLCLVLTLAAASFSSTAAGAGTDTPAQAALLRKLHGEWIGMGPCDGRLTLRIDGTYERRLHGPAGNNSSGRFQARAHGAPVLILTCEKSDDASDVGKRLEFSITAVDEKALSLRYGKQQPARFKSSRVQSRGP